MSELMDRIKRIEEAEAAPNPRCKMPDDCKWSVGIVSCWKCAHIAAGGKIYDWEAGMINPIDRSEPRERTAVADKAVKRPKHDGEARKRNDELVFGSDKWNMYANAIPKPVRAKLAVDGADIRAYYKELRSIGKDEFLKKYGG